MKRLYIIQNWNVESPGLIADYLNSERIPFDVIRTFENQPMPSADTCEAVIVLGYPEGAVFLHGRARAPRYAVAGYLLWRPDAGQSTRRNG
jgi:hypothetical protein